MNSAMRQQRILKMKLMLVATGKLFSIVVHNPRGIVVVAKTLALLKLQTIFGLYIA